MTGRVGIGYIGRVLKRFAAQQALGLLNYALSHGVGLELISDY